VNVLDEKLLTVGEVALRLRQSPRTVRDKIAAGTLPAVRIGDGPRAPIRIVATELERWLDGAATGAARSPRRAPEEAA
jgi:excisionase family DNA binding protein